jgi:16S rRNA (guanine966-N2)-methyltransferase
MASRKRKPAAAARGNAPRDPLRLRIIGGRFRGRRLQYGGDPRVRPMKDRVREAVFNLIGPAVRAKRAVDLFAGSGALGLEAISRGAESAVLIERHFPTAEVLRRNVAALGVEEITRVVPADVFLWWKLGPELGPAPWLVFCCPPYDFYVDRTDKMLELVGGLTRSAPGESVFALESDRRFDFGLLSDAEAWDVRAYPPAVVGIYRKPR